MTSNFRKIVEKVVEKVVLLWQTNPKRLCMYTSLILAAIWALYAVRLWGCSSRVGYKGPSWSPRSAARRALSKYDTDGDGMIGPGELEGSPALKACLPRADRNPADGRLDKGEISARINLYRRSQDFLLKTTCQVTLDGQPLAEATVKLVPDEFLGSVIEPASGTTNDQGMARLRMEGASAPGIRPGIYRVEISKKDESHAQTEEGAGRELLPARYNTLTTLGYEAAPDGGPEALKPKFELLGQQTQ